MSEVEVAVVIVSYKSAGLTVGCLRSLEQERSDPALKIRVIVVDNASGDGPEIARAIEENRWGSWATLVVAERNGGFAYGNNVGIQRAFRDGLPDYVHLLNPDTVVRKGAIRALVEFLEAHPAAGIAGGSFENQDGSDWPFAFRFPSFFSEIEGGLQLGLVTRLLSGRVMTRMMGPGPALTDWVSGASMMLRRKLLEAVGGLDENYFLYYEETDLCWRAKAAGFETWYVPESRVMHIAGQSTKVTERQAPTKRLPAYWFESRRRFFAANYGLPYAMATDLAALAAQVLGYVKRFATGRADHGIPYFIRDLGAHSVLRAKNRNVPALKAFRPSSGA